MAGLSPREAYSRRMYRPPSFESSLLGTVESYQLGYAPDVAEKYIEDIVYGMLGREEVDLSGNETPVESDVRVAVYARRDKELDKELSQIETTARIALSEKERAAREAYQKERDKLEKERLAAGGDAARAAYKKEREKLKERYNAAVQKKREQILSQEWGEAAVKKAVKAVWPKSADYAVWKYEETPIVAYVEIAVFKDGDMRVVKGMMSKSKLLHKELIRLLLEA